MDRFEILNIWRMALAKRDFEEVKRVRKIAKMNNVDIDRYK